MALKNFTVMKCVLERTCGSAFILKGLTAYLENPPLRLQCSKCNENSEVNLLSSKGATAVGTHVPFRLVGLEMRLHGLDYIRGKVAGFTFEPDGRQRVRTTNEEKTMLQKGFYFSSEANYIIIQFIS